MKAFVKALALAASAALLVGGPALIARETHPNLAVHCPS